MKLINVRQYPRGLPEGAIYIGRANPRRGFRTSPVANPFEITGNRSREVVIYQFEAWLEAQLRLDDPDVWRWFRELPEDATLACWCAPERCHGDVLIRKWRELRDAGKLDQIAP